MPDHQVGKTTKGARDNADVGKASGHRGEEQISKRRLSEDGEQEKDETLELSQTIGLGAKQRCFAKAISLS